MRIVVIGGTGTLGSKVVQHFAKEHEVITAGRSSGDYQIDISDRSSIERLFETIGKVDVIISTAGEAKWAPFDTLTPEDFEIGLKSKLMGQVYLVKVGLNYLLPKGSITLTTGILADRPVPMTTSAAMVNGGLHSFVKALALELDNNFRVNVVAPGLVQDSAEKYKDYFPGHQAISMEKMVSGYIQCVEGNFSGEVIRIYE